MKKIIKILGNSIGIIFNKEEAKCYSIKPKDIVDIELTKYDKQKEQLKEFTAKT
jgi:translation initiation factor IF-1